MRRLSQARTVTVDVDDTLVTWDYDHIPHKDEDLVYVTEGDLSKAFLPHFKNIQFVRNLKLQGYGVVVWSAGGEAWANKIVNILGMQDVVDLTMGKPELAVDDLLDARRILKQIVWIDPVTGEYKRNQ